MGLDLTYDAQGKTFTHRFSQADWATIEALRAHLPNDVDVCFEVPELGEPVRIKTAALKKSAATIDRFLADNPHLLPATYQIKFERFPVPGVPAGGFHTGGCSGLRLPGDPDHFYWIQAGLNECVLKKLALRPGRHGGILEERDLRGETELLTESAGKIQIRRVATKTTLRRGLRDILAFASSLAPAELTKIVG